MSDEVREVIRIQEARAAEYEKGARSMIISPGSSELVAAARLQAIAEGIRQVTMHLRGAYKISHEEMPFG